MRQAPERGKPGLHDRWETMGDGGDGDAEAVKDPVWLFVALLAIVMAGLWLADALPLPSLDALMSR